MKNTRSIAILIATYQGEPYLKQQLDSLLQQTNTDWTAYLHDDGSKDETRRIIKQYCKEYPDRFIEVEGPSCGSAKANFMYLTKSVESKLYMYCDQDDVWLERKIELTVKRMRAIYSKERPCLVYTDLKVVGEDLSVIADSMAKYQNLSCSRIGLSYALIQNVVTGCTMMINRALRNAMIRECNMDAIIMHDWWAALIANAFGRVSYLDKPTILYRQHHDNSVGAKRVVSFDNIKKMLNNTSEIKKSLELTRQQAKEFNRVFAPPKTLCSWDYAQIDSLGKLQRLYKYTHDGFLKSSVVRNIGLLVFG